MKHLFFLSLISPFVMVFAGYLMTVGTEMYYTIHGEPMIEEEIIDYTPTNPEISAEINHEHSTYSVLNSGRHIHFNG